MIDHTAVDTLFAHPADRPYADLVSEVVSSIDPSATCRLLLVDHAARHLRSLDDGRSFPIEGLLLDVLLDGERRDIGPSTWLPVKNGAHVEAMLEVRSVQAGRIPEIETLASVIGAHMTIVRDHIDTFERLRRRENMSVSAELQWSLLPTQTIESEHWRMSGSLEPAYDIAGDAFDHSLREDGFTATILDSMGHGDQAVLAAALALSSFRNAHRHGLSLQESFRLANRQMRQQFGGARYVTAFGISVVGDRAEVISAGHPLPWMLRPGGPERLTVPASLPLGLDELAEYPVTVLDELLDGILMITDGVTTARPDGGDAFGAGRVTELVGSAHWLEPRRLVRRLVEEAVLHRRGDIEDDICVYAAIRRR